jgi:HlyD family secretion protein
VLDAARGAARATASRREALQAALALVREGARRERRAAATQQARGARAAAAGARAAAADLVLLAPLTGVVTSRNAEPGEVLAPGQAVVTLGDVARPWARVYLHPSALAQVRLGDTLVAQVEGDSTPVRGRVAAIATQAEFTPRVALTEEERADLLLGVKVVFADSTGRLKAGLPVRVRLPAAAR